MCYFLSAETKQLITLTKDGATELGVWGVWDVLDIRGMWGGVWYSRGEKERYPHMGQYLPMKLYAPTIVVGG